MGSRTDCRRDLLLELSGLADRILSSCVRDVLPILFKHVSGWSEVSFATIAELVIIEECRLGYRREGIISCRGRRGSLSSRHVGRGGNGDNWRWCVVLNRHWRRSLYRSRGHSSSRSRVVRYAVELVGHPVGLIRQQRHARNHGHEIGHAKVHDRFFVMVKRRLQVCRHSDGLAWWWLREDLLGLIQYIIVTAAGQVSCCNKSSNCISLTVCKEDGWCVRV